MSRAAALLAKATAPTTTTTTTNMMTANPLANNDNSHAHTVDLRDADSFVAATARGGGRYQQRFSNEGAAGDNWLAHIGEVLNINKLPLVGGGGGGSGNNMNTSSTHGNKTTTIEEQQQQQRDVKTTMSVEMSEMGTSEDKSINHHHHHEDDNNPSFAIQPHSKDSTRSIDQSSDLFTATRSWIWTIFHTCCGNRQSHDDPHGDGNGNGNRKGYNHPTSFIEMCRRLSQGELSLGIIVTHPKVLEDTARPFDSNAMSNLMDRKPSTDSNNTNTINYNNPIRLGLENINQVILPVDEQVDSDSSWDSVEDDNDDEGGEGEGLDYYTGGSGYEGELGDDDNNQQQSGQARRQQRGRGGSDDSDSHSITSTGSSTQAISTQAMQRAYGNKVDEIAKFYRIMQEAEYGSSSVEHSGDEQQQQQQVAVGSLKSTMSSSLTSPSSRIRSIRPDEEQSLSSSLSLSLSSSLKSNRSLSTTTATNTVDKAPVTVLSDFRVLTMQQEQQQEQLQLQLQSDDHYLPAVVTRSKQKTSVTSPSFSLEERKTSIDQSPSSRTSNRFTMSRPLTSTDTSYTEFNRSHRQSLIEPNRLNSEDGSGSGKRRFTLPRTLSLEENPTGEGEDGDAPLGHMKKDDTAGDDDDDDNDSRPPSDVFRYSHDMTTGVTTTTPSLSPPLPLPSLSTSPSSAAEKESGLLSQPSSAATQYSPSHRSSSVEKSSSIGRLLRYPSLSKIEPIKLHRVNPWTSRQQAQTQQMHQLRRPLTKSTKMDNNNSNNSPQKRKKRLKSLGESKDDDFRRLNPHHHSHHGRHHHPLPHGNLAPSCFQENILTWHYQEGDVLPYADGRVGHHLHWRLLLQGSTGDVEEGLGGGLGGSSGKGFSSRISSGWHVFQIESMESNQSPLTKSQDNSNNNRDSLYHGQQQQHHHQQDDHLVGRDSIWNIFSRISMVGGTSPMASLDNNQQQQPHHQYHPRIPVVPAIPAIPFSSGEMINKAAMLKIDNNNNNNNTLSSSSLQLSAASNNNNNNNTTMTPLSIGDNNNNRSMTRRKSSNTTLTLTQQDLHQHKQESMPGGQD
eukprot:scaffold2642_cov183-Ochromonas_danica.AAC.15